MKRHHIRKSTGQVPVQNRPWSAQSTNSVATTPEIPSHCMQFTGNASNTLARTSQSKRAHHDDKSGHRRLPYQRHDFGGGHRVQQQPGFNAGSGYDQRDVMRDSLIYPPAGRRGSQWNTQTDRSRSAQRSGSQVAGQEEEIKQADSLTVEAPLHHSTTADQSVMEPIPNVTNSLDVARIVNSTQQLYTSTAL